MIQCKKCLFVFLSHYRKITIIKVRFGARARSKIRVKAKVRAWFRVKVRVKLQRKILTFNFDSLPYSGNLFLNCQGSLTSLSDLSFKLAPYIFF